jgi:hypothetical protein
VLSGKKLSNFKALTLMELLELELAGPKVRYCDAGIIEMRAGMHEAARCVAKPNHGLGGAKT